MIVLPAAPSPRLTVDLSGASVPIYPYLTEAQDYIDAMDTVGTAPDVNRCQVIDHVFRILKEGVTRDGTAIPGIFDDYLELGYLLAGHSRNESLINIKSPDDFTAGMTLAYDNQSGDFTLGDVLTGGTSSATGTIVADADGGTSGTLTLINVTGTFQNNETITDETTGSALVNGVLLEPDFAADRGFRGQVPLLTDNGFLSTTFNPSSDNTVSSQNDAWQSTFIHGGRAVNIMPNVIGNTSTRLIVQPSGSGNDLPEVTYSMNSTNFTTLEVTGQHGLFTTGRKDFVGGDDGSTHQYFARNGEAETKSAAASTGITNAVLHICKRNGFTTPYSPSWVSAFMYGGNEMTENQRRYVLWPAMYRYMRAVGAYV